MNGNQFQNAHLRAARCMVYALELGGYDAWAGASKVWSARLTNQERAAMAFAALKSLKADHALATVEAAISEAGTPLAPLLDPLDEASFWVQIASLEELECYCTASFLALPPDRQAEFCDYARRAAA